MAKNNTRPEKGTSKMEFLPDYIVIDFETTGLSPQYDCIIEIGALKVQKGEISEQYSTLVNPGFELDPFISELTGITDEMLHDAPAIADVLPLLIDFIGNDTVIAHNANFDINFLYDNCLNILKDPFSNDFIDTMRVSRRIFKDIKCHRLSNLVELLKLDGQAEHRALGDCQCTHQLYQYMMQYVAENQIDTNTLFAITHNYNAKAMDIKATVTDYDTSHPLYEKVCVFTGALECFSRKEAMQIVANLGGINGDSVTKKTNFLVLGNNDYCASIKDGKSSKHKKAEALMLQGQDLAIIPETTFYDMLGVSVVVPKPSIPRPNQQAHEFVKPYILKWMKKRKISADRLDYRQNIDGSSSCVFIPDPSDSDTMVEIYRVHLKKAHSYLSINHIYQDVVPEWLPSTSVIDNQLVIPIETPQEALRLYPMYLEILERIIK